MRSLEIFYFKKPGIFSAYQEKLRYKIDSRVFDYYEFVRKNTPENSKILIPPQGYPWPATGNAAYSRYFLYPRHLISGKQYEPGIDLKKENIEYVLIVWGESEGLQYDFTHGWPKFSVPAKKIVYQEKTNGVFEYEEFVLKKDCWGLIEVDLERL